MYVYTPLLQLAGHGTCLQRIAGGPASSGARRLLRHQDNKDNQF
jgi:hypothetical protein